MGGIKSEGCHFNGINGICSGELYRTTALCSLFKTNSIKMAQRVFRQQLDVGDVVNAIPWVKTFEEPGIVLGMNHGVPRRLVILDYL